MIMVIMVPLILTITMSDYNGNTENDENDNDGNYSNDDANYDNDADRCQSFACETHLFDSSSCHARACHRNEFMTLKASSIARKSMTASTSC